jgi:hypothetical protein
MKKPKIHVITGEKGLGMSYSTVVIEIGKRDWYVKAQQKLIEDMEKCRNEDKKLI